MKKAAKISDRSCRRIHKSLLFHSCLDNEFVLLHHQPAPCTRTLPCITTFSRARTRGSGFRPPLSSVHLNKSAYTLIPLPPHCIRSHRFVDTLWTPPSVPQCLVCVRRVIKAELLLSKSHSRSRPEGLTSCLLRGGGLEKQTRNGALMEVDAPSSEGDKNKSHLGEGRKTIATSPSEGPLFLPKQFIPLII